MLNEASVVCEEFRISLLEIYYEQERLNNLMILHVHRDLTDTLNLEVVSRDFVSLNEFSAEFVWRLRQKLIELAYLLSSLREMSNCVVCVV